MADPNIEFLSSNQNNLMVTGLLEGIKIALTRNSNGDPYKMKMMIQNIKIKRDVLDDGTSVPKS